ncbi:TPA: 2-amino-4-hydroxy-6-hydroxymethyldihydropteridine diphosphokinase [Legionella feeleii]|uniref:2-amino-4-hydroxy-6-hydroxymethyldihydropteridine pyrophosphokinase n=1 Tax=Legionella feeleii TaxID=453 RepID=A0A378ITK9_9GAMM|nr:2-amino-4-hydroxy-6-hydroxymethyldihydropteridine diphosphokinase [Legionella feeleii]STX38479.1 2-amino-4-hydroxy-6-hydroxymethyldihydropteridinepyrophosphokinase [Legionella feeleii]
MISCYLGLGSNLRSPQRQLRRALNALRTLPSTQVTKVASFYRSSAWGRKAQPDYYNTVVALQTSLTPEQLLTFCQKIERQQGRIRKIRWGSRTLDIDILLFGTRKINSTKIIVPHPRLHLRDFVFVPLLELFPKPVVMANSNLSMLIKESKCCSTIKQ